jgi:hypothetical protein
MRKIIVFLVIFFLFPVNNHFQESEKPRIDSPQPSEEIRGSIIISGNTDITDFSSSEISFGYSGSSTWFPIMSSDQPVRNGPIAQWDTTVISDGLYQIRVSVHLKGGTSADTIVADLKVSNSLNKEESSTQPAPVITTAEPTQTVVNIPIFQTATSLPRNPASVENNTLNTVILVSGISIASIFFIVILLQALRSKKK